MSPGAPSPQTYSELPYQELWRRQILRWLARLPHGPRLGSPESILEAVQGSLWLDCQGLALDDAVATRILRRTLYREYEVAWKHSTLPLADRLGQLSAPDPPALELPPHLHDLADAYLLGLGSAGSLRRAMAYFGSRRKVRCLNTLLLDVLTDGAPLQDLKRRTARLFAAAARDGITPAHAREARYLRRALRMLEPSHKVCLMQDSLKGILPESKLP
ncbi:MAG: hypothetical protein COA70_02760 [Planctomycetota bacterium]|nr:MAG: hypothetical protein COA70_02760 [Planctomycetota bacterium]